MIRLTFVKLAAITAALGAGSIANASGDKYGKKHDDKQEHKTEQKTELKGHDDAQHVEISLADLKKAIETKSVFLVDANSAKTYEKGHLPGALSFAKNEKEFAKLLPQDKNALIVAYCGGPMCSAWEDAAEAATKAGYTNIKHFKGGLKGWKSAGLSLETPTAKK
ncbi:MAG: hypothetical protein RIQ81_1184 [Pseudomonadota bacterium]|jgi:rhodanese-related sulfurtransferase